MSVAARSFLPLSDNRPQRPDICHRLVQLRSPSLGGNAGEENTDRWERSDGMTDHPRFEPVRNAPDQAHLNYNGGRLVDWVLRLVDWWLGMRESKSPGAWVMRAATPTAENEGRRMRQRDEFDRSKRPRRQL